MATAKIRPLVMEDLDHMMTWVNDDEIVGNFANFTRPISRDQERQYLERIIDSKTDKAFAIEAEDGSYLGNIGVYDIHWPSRVETCSCCSTSRPSRGGSGTRAERRSSTPATTCADSSSDLLGATASRRAAPVAGG